jgi:hypothetical protein
MWEGPVLDRFGRPVDEERAPTSSRVFRMALVELSTGKVLAERKLAEPVQSAVLTDTSLALLTSGSPRCELLKLPTLEREKALVASAPIVRAEMVGKLLALQTQSGSELHELGTFKRVGLAENQQGLPRTNSPAIMVTSQGLVMRGLLLDAEMKPLLLLSPDGLPALAGADPQWRPAFAKGKLANEGTGQFYRPDLERNGQTQVAAQTTPDGKHSLSLTMRSQFKQVPGAVHTSRQEIELALAAAGESNQRQVILREERPQGVGGASAAATPKLRLTNAESFVVYGASLYRWPLPGAKAAATASAPRVALVPRQTALALAGTGKTTLKHQAEGGKAPLKFTVFTPYDGITINENTGDVTIDEAAMLTEAQRSLEQTFTRSARGEPYADALRTQGAAMVARASEILGRKPKGIPVAIPIRVDVSDADLAGDKLQYYVLAEVPSAPVLERLKQLDDERQKQLAQRPVVDRPVVGGGDQPVRPVPEGGQQDMAALQRRVEALEERLDLVTRQLNAVLKKLDE